MMISLANVLLYICLAILTGYFFLMRITEKARPSIYISEKSLKWIILLIPIFLFVPVIRVIITLYNQFSLPAAKYASLISRFGLDWNVIRRSLVHI
ncbi:hypothetical protein [Halalkalibacter lacteus]|uniref:hypothetical protein n=1 Tax=Halalkalibacter lacteus TaxID=3090663 RepID=UPI002FC68BF0